MPGTLDGIDAALGAELAHRRRPARRSASPLRAGAGCGGGAGFGAVVQLSAPRQPLRARLVAAAPRRLPRSGRAARRPRRSRRPSPRSRQARRPAGAGTSIVTLSVSSSTSGSSTATVSPAFLNHLPMVASVTDSPRVGTRMSVIAVSCSRLIRTVSTPCIADLKRRCTRKMRRRRSQS